MGTKIEEKREIRYKTYDQNQQISLPIMLKGLIQENSLVQIVDKVVESIDMSDLDQCYSGAGRPAYHPKMLIKVWIYGYCREVYTSRKIAQKLREDLGFIWLWGNQQPCFKTLSSFRSVRMQGLLDEVLVSVLSYLVVKDYIDLEDLYVDGSKWEGNANKHKVIWRKNMERYEEAVRDRVKEFLEEVWVLQGAEDAKYGKKDLAIHQESTKIAIELNSAFLSEQISELNERIAQKQERIEEQQAQKPKAKEERAALKQEKANLRKLKSWSNKLDKEKANLLKYEEQARVLNGRNSYSKTDTDATALRMKDDSLKPGYNAQISTSNQFIVQASIHQNASDNVTLSEHLAALENSVDHLVKRDLVQPDWRSNYTGDAGYGSEENYELLEERGFTAYVKYPSWYAEHTGKISEKTYNKYNWNYDKEQDCFFCPQGKRLTFLEDASKTNRNGFTQAFKVYECESCSACPVFKECRGQRAQADTNRKVFINEKLEAHKQKAKDRLASELGKEKRSKRGSEVETPFGDLKFNMGHRRFLLRTLPKVSVEFNLLCIAHNIRKVFCKESGVWEAYYAQRRAKRAENKEKVAKNSVFPTFLNILIRGAALKQDNLKIVYI